jgi:hypothetical protein
MEGLGACYTLPLSDHAIMKSALKIYSSWLKACPAKAKPIEQQFICDLLSHLSQLFDPAKAKKGEEAGHTELLTSVLDIFETLVRNRSSELEVSIARAGERQERGPARARKPPGIAAAAAAATALLRQKRARGGCWSAKRARLRGATAATLLLLPLPASKTKKEDPAAATAAAAAAGEVAHLAPPTPHLPRAPYLLFFFYSRR